MRDYTQEVIIAIGHVMELADTSHLGPDTNFEEDLGFDSGLYIELIMYLEDQLPGVSIDPAILRRDDFLTVGSAAAFISRLMQQPGGSAS